MISNNLRQKIKLIVYYFVMWIIGFLLAFWFGLGWFFLFHTLRYFLFASPRLYLPMIKIVVGADFAESERIKFKGKENRWFISPISVALTLINMLFTFFVFWKINIPIISFFK